MCPHTRFNNETSSTFNQISGKLSIEYGIGSAKGVYGSDAVTIGSATMNNQTIGLVSNTTNILAENDDYNSNGILGLAFPDLSTKSGTKPGHLVTNLYQSNVISEPVFSIFLNSQFKYGRSGEIVLGGTDTTKYNANDLHYLPVVSYDVSAYDIVPNLGTNSTRNGTHLYWAVPGQGVSTSTGYESPSNVLRDYILDTGTTLTYVPADIAKGIAMSVTSNAKTTVLDTVNGAYRVNCNLAKNSNATVQFMMSSSASTVSTTPITITIPLSELIVPVDALTPETSTSCIFGIAPLPTSYELTSGESWIIGEATLRSVYSVYDLRLNRVGLAKLSVVSNKTNTTDTIDASPNTVSVKDDDAALQADDNNTSSSSNTAPYPWMIIVLSMTVLCYL